MPDGALPPLLLLLLAGALRCEGAGTLSQLGADIVGTMNNGKFGHHVGLSSDGSRLIVGNNPDGPSPTAEVYTYSSSSWVQLG